jgi:hypothetical protein
LKKENSTEKKRPKAELMSEWCLSVLQVYTLDLETSEN